MIFTREDILKIQNALLQLGRKDSEFKDANTPLNSNDEIAILQDGINKKVSISNLLSTLGLLKKDDFINVSDRYDEYYIRLSEAITIIAKNKRKKGLVITFQDLNGDWKIFQFDGELNNFSNTDYWKDLFDYEQFIANSILPDEEDLTLTLPNERGNSFVKLKDKEYDPADFSGMGIKIIRKNIIEVTQEDGTIKRINYLSPDIFNSENTIYIIQYDFTIGEDITIPTNCVLKFDGGCISGDNTIIGNNTRINAVSIGIFGNNVEIAGTWNVEYVLLDWFMPDNNGYYNKSFKNALKVCKALHCTEGKSYSYSGELVDCRDMYGNLLITGNKCTFIRFFFAYDIKPDNNPNIISSVNTFKYIINDIRFYGYYANEKPCLFFGLPFEIYNCNFVNYVNVIGCTPTYLDCVTLCNVNAWNSNNTRINLFSVFDYSFTPATGFIADWFSLNNVSARSYINIGIKDEINIHMTNSLNIAFDFVKDSSNYNYAIVTCHAINCHWENSTPIILNNNAYLNLITSFIFDKCYFYSSAIPQNDRVLECVIFKNSRIMYWNNNNYAEIPNLHKSIFTHYNIISQNSVLQYLSTDFNAYNLNKNRVIEGTVTPAKSSYYYISAESGKHPKLNYTEQQSVQYLIAYSTREDCLYNGGNTPIVYWSNTLSIPSGKFGAITIYINSNPYSYVHVYRKDMSNNSIKYVVFRACRLRKQTGEPAVHIVDTPQCVFGYPWQEYTGQETEIKYVETV